MKYLIIGLGVFGRNLAVDLNDTGAEVIGVDNRNEAIDDVKDIISTTYIIDATDENALALLPFNNIDLTIVALGNNFGASVKTVALLKKAGVKRLMVRAIDDIHESILEGMGVERILTPEKKSALNLAAELAINSKLDSFAITQNQYIFKFLAPTALIGLSYTDLYQNGFYGMRLITASRAVIKRNIIGMITESQQPLEQIAEAKVEQDDQLTFFGPLDKFKHFCRQINTE